MIVFQHNCCEHWCTYPHPDMSWNMSDSRLFQLLPFISSHFHFLIIVEFATPVQWIYLELWTMGFTKSLSVPMWHSHPFLMSQITYSYISNSALCQSQWPCGLRHRSVAAHLLRLWFQIPSGAWMSVVNVLCCQVEVSVMSWTLIQRNPTDWCVIEFDLEISWMRRPWPTVGCLVKNNNSAY